MHISALVCPLYPFPCLDRKSSAGRNQQGKRVTKGGVFCPSYYMHWKIGQSREVKSYQGDQGSPTGRVSQAYLHGDEPVVNLHLFSEKVCSDSGFVLAGELLIDVLVHE